MAPRKIEIEALEALQAADGTDCFFIWQDGKLQLFPVAMVALETPAPHVPNEDPPPD